MVPTDCDTFQPLEDLIRQVFIPVLTGCSPPNDNSWLLYAFPACWGGLSILVPASGCAGEMAASCGITEPLVQYILNHGLSSLMPLLLRDPAKPVCIRLSEINILVIFLSSINN